MLFSATSTKKTEDLVRLALKKEPIYVGIDEDKGSSAATVAGLEQVNLRLLNASSDTRLGPDSQ